ncbi:MAG: hydroxyethylthiazole kinase [Saccharofermentans sp.]|nr:hydroxyethylthiazole kinase [Saccharofermentans sp.]
MAQKSSGKDHLIHCITNPISMNQCANAILALGAKPIMAEHPEEVAEITRTASALLLNLGNISDVRMASMKISLKEANVNDIPVILDAVGVSCSSLRRKFVRELLSEGKFFVIKGNYSEILAIYDDNYTGIGVDAEEGLKDDLISRAVLSVSGHINAIAVATGEVDLISDGNTVNKVTGGCKQMSSVTGTGCMAGAVIATYAAKERSLESVIDACTFFKKCGLRSKTDKGNGTYMVNLIDNLGEPNGI